MKFRIFNNSYLNSFTIRSTTNNYALLFYFLGLLAREIIVMHIQKMYNVFMYKKTKRTIVRTKANTRFNSILNVFIDSLKQKRSRYFQTSKLWLLKKYTVSEKTSLLGQIRYQIIHVFSVSFAYNTTKMRFSIMAIPHVVLITVTKRTHLQAALSGFGSKQDQTARGGERLRRGLTLNLQIIDPLCPNDQTHTQI